MVIKFNCKTCGQSGQRCYAQNKVPQHFFCSVPCQNEWQKSREDIIIKNKDPEFRKKVSMGLKNRKKLLGDNYHSEETKSKIGKATLQHWQGYSDSAKNKLLSVLYENSQRRKTFKSYDCDWRKISKKLRSTSICERCGKNEKLMVHHIKPIKCGGDRDIQNLSVLCISCHRIVENETNKIFNIIGDWETVSFLVKSKLIIRGLKEWRLPQKKFQT